MTTKRAQSLVGSVPHPGEILKDELEARGLTSHALSIALRLPASRLNQIVRGQRGISPETALRLARYFGGSAALWLRLQAAYAPGRLTASMRPSGATADLAQAEAALADKIAAEVTPAAA